MIEGGLCAAIRLPQSVDAAKVVPQTFPSEVHGVEPSYAAFATTIVPRPRSARIGCVAWLASLVVKVRSSDAAGVAACLGGSIPAKVTSDNAARALLAHFLC
jgi:hypothetical protein